MSETPHEWKYLDRRPGSRYQQLCIKGKRIWAWTLYCDLMNEKDPRTPQELAEDWGFHWKPFTRRSRIARATPPNSRPSEG
jgi:hypothetical protein